ncbi:hypothetical protein ACFLIM_43315 [Nonomuraea sp. M3C6]|uniref:Phytanoyl-CoA dioxygenase (PhyH) n=1 Tax=Nonomuraea marmarensis TaxID=3351344 RepID=A0ABW7AV92_9ACTN
MTTNDEVLTADQVEQFLDKGYVLLRECFTREAAEQYTGSIWDRLGYEADDPSTWALPSVHMPAHQRIDIRTFAPKAWRAACELVGGAERISTEQPYTWSDGFIVNLRQDADRPWQPASNESPGWHVDGNFFRHYLDSPEQGLLTLVLWSDVEHQGGATFIATDSVGPVTRFLAEHPGGLLPSPDPDDDTPVIPYADLARQCTEFVEATGQVGDVYLVHPFVLHAKSQNVLRRPRFITNSTLILAEPMRFDRPEPGEHSLVERAVLRALGVDRYDFTPAGPRTRLVSELSKTHERMLAEERRRLAATGRTDGH